MKLVKSIVFIALLFVVGYGMYIYFSPRALDNSLIAQIQTGIIIDSGAVNTENVDRMFILNSGQRIGRHGRKVGGEHFGLVDVVSGTVLISGSEIIGGGVDVDLRTIQVDGLTGTLYEQLIFQLKESFFQVQDFPTASLQILGMTGFTLSEDDSTGFDSNKNGSGLVVNLTMHGITNQIIVPVVVDLTGNNLSLDSVFYLDRTKWGIVEAEGVVDTYFGISGKLTFSQQ